MTSKEYDTEPEAIAMASGDRGNEVKQPYSRNVRIMKYLTDV